MFYRAKKEAGVYSYKTPFLSVPLEGVNLSDYVEAVTKDTRIDEIDNQIWMFNKAAETGAWIELKYDEGFLFSLVQKDPFMFFSVAGNVFNSFFNALRLGVNAPGFNMNYLSKLDPRKIYVSVKEPAYKAALASDPDERTLQLGSLMLFDPDKTYSKSEPFTHSFGAGETLIIAKDKRAVPDQHFSYSEYPMTDEVVGSGQIMHIVENTFSSAGTVSFSGVSLS